MTKCVNVPYSHFQHPISRLSGVVVMTLDLRLAVVGSKPGHDTAGYFLVYRYLLRRLNYLGM